MLRTSGASSSGAPRAAAWPRMLGAATTVREAARAALIGALETARRGVGYVEHEARERRDAMGERAAVATEIAARTATAPADVAREVRKELEAWSSGVARIGAIALVLGVLGLFALVILSVGVIVLLNEVLGDPFGTLLVGALYVVAVLAGVAWLIAIKRETEAEVARHAAHADAEVEKVKEQISEALHPEGESPTNRKPSSARPDIERR